MEHMANIIFLCLIFNIMKFTKKKLITLMMLELLMFTIIIIYSFYHLSLKSSVFYMILFSLFMVLDSVYGICILIHNSRNDSIFSINKIIF